MQTVHLGLSAVGMLFAHAATQIRVSDISGGPVAAVGWLMADLGEFIPLAQELSATCRKHTADYSPPNSSRCSTSYTGSDTAA